MDKKELRENPSQLLNVTTAHFAVTVDAPAGRRDDDAGAHNDG
jgi:hypothetical protein